MTITYITVHAVYLSHCMRQIIRSLASVCVRAADALITINLNITAHLQYKDSEHTVRIRTVGHGAQIGSVPVHRCRPNLSETAKFTYLLSL